MDAPALILQLSFIEILFEEPTMSMTMRMGFRRYFQPILGTDRCKKFRG
jgi:hypothetical protein